MPQYTEQQKLYILQQMGYDPNKFEVTDNDTIRSKVTIQPTVSGHTITPENVVAPKYSELEAASRMFINKAPAAAGAGTGFVTATALAGRFLPGWGRYGALAAGLLGGALTSAGVGATQKAIMPKEYLDEMSQMGKEHPYIDTGTGLATIPLGGMSPGIKEGFRAGRTALNLATTGKVIPLGRKALTEASKVDPALINAELQNLANVGAGSAIVAGMGAGHRAVAKPQEGETRLGNIFDPKALLSDALTGYWFNKPNVIGRKVMGFHPVEAPGESPRPGRPDLFTTKEVSDIVEAIRQQNEPRQVSESFGLQPTRVPVMAKGKPVYKTIKIVSGGKTITTKEPVYKDVIPNDPFAGKDIIVGGKESYRPLYPASATRLAQEQLAIAELAKTVPKEGLTTKIQRDIETIGMEQELAAQKEAARLAAQQKQPQVVPTKGPAQPQPPGSIVSGKRMELRRPNRLLKQQVGGIGEKPEIRPEPLYYEADGTPVYMDKTTGLDKALTEKPTAKELEIERIQKEFDRKQAEPAETTVSTPGIDEVNAGLKKAGVSGVLTPKWFQKMQSWGAFRGVKLDVDNKLVDSFTGKPIGGIALLKQGVQDLVNRVALVSPKDGSSITTIHELLHFFLADLANSPRPGDRARYVTFKKVVEQSKELKPLLDALKAKGYKDPVEELLVKSSSTRLFERLANLKDQTNWQHWWADFKAHLKYRYNKSNLNLADIDRLLGYEFMAAEKFKPGEITYRLADRVVQGRMDEPSELVPIDSPEIMEAINEHFVKKIRSETLDTEKALQFKSALIVNIDFSKHPEVKDYMDKIDPESLPQWLNFMKYWGEQIKGVKVPEEVPTIEPTVEVPTKPAYEPSPLPEWARKEMIDAGLNPDEPLPTTVAPKEVTPVKEKKTTAKKVVYDPEAYKMHITGEEPVEDVEARIAAIESIRPLTRRLTPEETKDFSLVQKRLAGIEQELKDFQGGPGSLIRRRYLMAAKENLSRIALKLQADQVVKHFEDALASIPKDAANLKRYSETTKRLADAKALRDNLEREVTRVQEAGEERYSEPSELEVDRKLYEEVKAKHLGMLRDGTAFKGERKENFTPEYLRLAQQIEDIKRKYKGMPPGEVSAEYVPKQSEPSELQTETSGFKKWFGDSKVVNEKGKPIVVYHSASSITGKWEGEIGTPSYRWKVSPRDINVFAGGHFGTKNQANQHIVGGLLESPVVYPVFLRIENPKRVVDVKNSWFEEIAKAKKEGYDGLVYKNEYEPNVPLDEILINWEKYANEANTDKPFSELSEGAKYARWFNRGEYWLAKRNIAKKDEGNLVDSYIPFYPEQVKSATGNRGTFDITNADIRYSEPSELRTYQDLTPEERAVYSRLHTEAFNARNTQLKRPSDEANNALIDAENALDTFQKERGLTKQSEPSELLPDFQVIPSTFWERYLKFPEKATVSASQVFGRLRNAVGADSLTWDILKMNPEFMALENSAKRITKDEFNSILKKGDLKVTVETYGMEGKISEAKKEYDKMTHEWYEKMTPDERGTMDVYLSRFPEDMLDANQKAERKALIEKYGDNIVKYRELQEQVKNEVADMILDDEPRDISPRATFYYNTVSALPANEPMPEWTTTKSGKNVQRVDVVIPKKIVGQGQGYEEWAARRRANGQDSHRNVYNEIYPDGILEENPLWQPDNLHENLPNTVGWTMIQYTTGPKGEKIAVIEEVQSRWGQEVRRQQKEAEKGQYHSYNADAINHPLLRDYNRLILKAAIGQAKKEGATHIVVSDAETAMMTEGHDQQSSPVVSSHALRSEAEEAAKAKPHYYVEAARKDGRGPWYVKTTHPVQQEPGMRLNYDTILPKIAEELTGNKGERMSLGEHKNAREGYQTVDTYGADLTRPTGTTRLYPKEIEKQDLRQNLIFRNPDGTPKIDVSGMMYDITGVSKYLETEPFTLGMRKLAEPSTVEKGGEIFDYAKEKMQKGKEEKEVKLGEEQGGVVEPTITPPKPGEIKEPVSEKASFLPFLTGVFDKVGEVHKTPTGKLVTDKLLQMWYYKDWMEGQIGNRLVQATKAYTPDQINKVYKHLWHMDDEGKSPLDLDYAEKDLSKSIIELVRYPRQVQIKEGLLVKAGKKYREAGVKPEGYMFNMLEPEAAYNWANKPANDATVLAQDKAYIAHQVKHGVDPAKAAESLHEYKAALGNRLDPDATFAAIRRAEGNGLPWELVDKNFASAAVRYGARAARDLAYFKYIQSDPRVLKALNLKDQFGKYVDKTLYPDTELLTSKAVSDAMLYVAGADVPTNPKLMAAARVGANTVMGAGTAARNLVNAGSFTAQYVQVSQLPLVWEAFSKMNEARVRAFESNAIKVQFQDFDAAGFRRGSPDPFIRYANEVSYLMRRYQGRDLSDRLEGTWYYTIGELLATDNIARAKQGNKESQWFVNKFGETVEGGASSLLKRNVTQEDISRMAKRLVDSARGTYGPTGLPNWAMKGSLAPFAALSRFSIEKSNTIWKDVIQPARQGIYGPLLRYTLASLGVGAVIDQLNDLLSHKRGQDLTINEALKSGSKEEILAKAIGLFQFASTAGIISDLFKVAIQAYRGKDIKYMNQPLSFPLYTLVTDTLARNTIDAAKAIREGEDPFEVLTKYVAVLGRQSSQTWRYIDANFLRPDEAKRKEKFRDYRVWQELEGTATLSDAGRPNEFLNMGVKEFKREEDIGKAAGMLPDLIKKALEDANGNPDKLRRNLLKIKLNNYQTMPNPETMPFSFTSYVEWMRKTQGADKAAKVMADYFKKNAVNKAKSELVPTF